MKKEKKIKAHTRRTKSGKTITVKAHTAKYDAAEELKKAAKKKGAGDELASLKTPNSYEQHGFTKEEFAEWYEGTGSEADKKVSKALRKAMGSKAYNDLSDSAADSYKAGGADSFFKKGIKKMQAVTNSSAKSGGNEVSSDLVKKYAHHEDISVKEARSELSTMSNKEFMKTKAHFDKQPVPKSSAAVEREAERSLSKSANSRLSALKKSLSKEQVNRLKEVGLTPTTFAEKFGGSYSDGKFTRTKRTQTGTRFTHKPVTKSFDAWIDLYEKTGGFELGEPIRKVSKKMSSKTKA